MKLRMAIHYDVQSYTVKLTACEPGEEVTDISVATKVARSFFSTLDADVEHFVVIALGARGRVVGIKEVSRGTPTATLVHPREVFLAAIRLNAMSIVVVHNHPSGDPTPSEEDRELSQRLRDAGELLGIPVVDSVVLGSKRSVSIFEAPGTPRAKK